MVIRVLHTKSAHTACKTLLKMDRWSPKHVELTNVMNKLNHKKSCVSFWTTYTLQDDTQSLKYQIFVHFSNLKSEETAFLARIEWHIQDIFNILHEPDTPVRAWSWILLFAFPFKADFEKEREFFSNGINQFAMWYWPEAKFPETKFQDFYSKFLLFRYKRCCLQPVCMVAKVKFDNLVS